MKDDLKQKINELVKLINDEEILKYIYEFVLSGFNESIKRE